MRIVIVEDYVDLLQVMMLTLQHAGHEVRGVSVLQDLNPILADFRPQVVILDVMLPDGDGIEMAARLSVQPELSVIMLTARSSETDKVRAMRGGADHYLVKPVSQKELLAVLESVQQKVAPEPLQAPTPFAGWTLHGARQSVLSPMGVEVPLTHREYLLLGRLMSSPGEAVVRESIIRALGHDPRTFDERRLHVAVSRLRRKLQQSTGQHAPLRAQWGVGYLFAGACRVLECAPQ